MKRSKWIEQEIVTRTRTINDNGDFVYEEFDTFVCRVSSIADDMTDKGQLLNISYPTKDIAIIVYIPRDNSTML